MFRFALIFSDTHNPQADFLKLHQRALPLTLPCQLRIHRRDVRVVVGAEQVAGPPCLCRRGTGRGRRGRRYSRDHCRELALRLRGNARKVLFQRRRLPAGVRARLSRQLARLVGCGGLGGVGEVRGELVQLRHLHEVLLRRGLLLPAQLLPSPRLRGSAPVPPLRAAPPPLHPLLPPHHILVLVRDLPARRPALKLIIRRPLGHVLSLPRLLRGAPALLCLLRAPPPSTPLQRPQRGLRLFSVEHRLAAPPLALHLPLCPLPSQLLHAPPRAPLSLPRHHPPAVLAIVAPLLASAHQPRRLPEHWHLAEALRPFRPLLR
mmetsp:Transcript_16389/g.39305  ORF Transcript_16389/g.39305 Transcript_16389/m.39305 type:complete len:319 (-) Transcript_16389:4166-5122(-)